MARIPRRSHALLAIAALAAPGAFEALPAREEGGAAIERILEPSIDDPTDGAADPEADQGLDFDRLEEQVLGLLPDGAVVSVARALVDRRIGLSVSGKRALVVLRITLD